MRADRPIDYRTACLRQAARVIKAHWMGYKAAWSVAPLAARASIDDELWLGGVKFSKPLQSHHSHSIALAGCFAELQFRPESPHHPHSDKVVAEHFEVYSFTETEIHMMTPYCRANAIPLHQIRGAKYYTGMWQQVVAEARAGRFRESGDVHRFVW